MEREPINTILRFNINKLYSNSMISFIENKLQNLGFILDTKIFKNPLIFKISCAFFNRTSRITNFLLFNTIGYSCFLFFLAFFSYYNFEGANEFILKLQLFGVSQITSIFFSMPISFQFFILFILLFYQTIFLNTLLAYSKKIGVFMKTKYNDEDVLKKIHYNSGFTTAVRSLIPAGVVVCVFCGKDAMDAYKVKTTMEAWKIVAELAINAKLDPPECPVQVSVITTNTSNTALNFPSSK